MTSFRYPREWRWEHVIDAPRSNEPLYCRECHKKWPCVQRVLMDFIDSLQVAGDDHEVEPMEQVDTKGVHYPR